MLSKAELQHIVLAKQNGWTEFYPVGRDAEMATELLSLREQLEALKVWATNRAIGDDALENENYTSIIVNWRQRQLNDLLTNEKHSIFIAVQEALATAAKPAEDSEVAKFMAGVKNSMAQEIAGAIQKSALGIMFDEITPDTETIAMQYESLVKRVNRPEDKPDEPM